MKTNRANKVSITVYPESDDVFGMTFYIPIDRDTEEYIVDMIDDILSEKYQFVDWEFD